MIDLESILSTWEDKLQDPGTVSRIVSLALHGVDHTDAANDKQRAQRERARKRKMCNTPERLLTTSPKR